MNILCITASPNRGLYKLMKILNTRGNNIFLLYHGVDYNTAYGWNLKIFKKIYKFPDYLYVYYTQYVNLNKSISLINDIVINHKIDLIHSVNIYDDFLSFAACHLRKVPVIYVVVDMHSLISYPLTWKHPFRSLGHVFGRIYTNYLEKQTYKLSAGYAFTSEHVKRIAIIKYGIKSSNSIILSNYISSEDIITQGQKKLSAFDNKLHFVYEGNIGTSGYGYILPCILGITKHNIHVHLYCPQKPQSYILEFGDNPYVHWEKWINPEEIPYELTKYDYGLMPFNEEFDRKHLDAVLPNKLFDYLAACLPVVSPPFKSLKYFIESNDVGIVFENVDDLMEKLNTEDQSKFIKNIMNVREQFTIENNVNRVINLYEKVLKV